MLIDAGRNGTNIASGLGNGCTKVDRQTTTIHQNARFPLYLLAPLFCTVASFELSNSANQLHGREKICTEILKLVKQKISKKILGFF